MLKLPSESSVYVAMFSV